MITISKPILHVEFIGSNNITEHWGLFINNKLFEVYMEKALADQKLAHLESLLLSR